MIYKMPYSIWDRLSDMAPVDENGFMQGWLVEGYIEMKFGLRCIDTDSDCLDYEIVDDDKFKRLTIMFLMAKNND